MKGTHAADRLISYVQRIERLEEEKREISTSIADIKKEAKATGFDPKVINQMLRERRMNDAERQEWQALCETYRAALGMLDGTPLGQHARDRFMRVRPEPEAEDGEKEDLGPALPFENLPPAESAPNLDTGPKPPTPEELLTARAEGGAAAIAGKKVTESPYPASDPRRASWDEGWCATAGSDGMEIPAAFRRSTPKKGNAPGKGAGQ